MKIAILDGYTLNAGDLDWSGLLELGECVIYDRTKPDETADHAVGAEIVLTNKVAMSRSTMEQLPLLRYIGVLATGVNVVDLDAAKDLGITVTNIPSYSTNSVAQMAFALLLELVSKVGQHSATTSKEWSKSEDFCYYHGTLHELAGRTFGIIGYGSIGRRAGAIARAFGMEVIATGRRTGTADDGTKLVPLDELLRSSDVVSLHCPLTAENRHLIDAETLRWMKPSAYLINTARGGLIDSAALADVLREGEIAGAGLDVLETEPPSADDPLLSAPNCVITPHIAWATFEARKRLLDVAVGNIKAFLAGKPVNVVS